MKNLAKGHTAVQVNPRKGFRIHLLVFILTIPATWIIWFVFDRTYPWPLWQTIAWTIGLTFHYLGVFVFKKIKADKPNTAQEVGMNQ